MDLNNLPLVEELYARYRSDPSGVDSSWRHFFDGVEFGSLLGGQGGGQGEAPCDERSWRLVGAFRRYGHLLARVNPIAAGTPEAPSLRLENFGYSQQDLDRPVPTFGAMREAKAPLGELVKALLSVYASRIGFEYMDLGNEDLERWIQERIEPSPNLDAPLEDKKIILEALNRSEIFETFLHTKFSGQKRFSLQGIETLIPILGEAIDAFAAGGGEEMRIGMAHRGRLNVLANILGKPYAMIFREFDDTFYPLEVEGSGDVKYHKGFSSYYKTRGNREVLLHLAANPSHLETVDAVVLGETRARQVALADEAKQRAMALLIHGDAAVAGQGIVYETLQFCRLHGYGTGGTIHIVLNNQVGFTTVPRDARSTPHCTDIAKAFGVPVFHVNAEDPEGCVFAAKLAVQIRQRFGCDVFLDVNGYRAYGHNEGDEPSFTQPLEYKIIRQKKSIRLLYSEALLAKGEIEHDLASSLEAQFKGGLEAQLSEARSEGTAPPEFAKAFGAPPRQPKGVSLFDPVATAVDPASLQQAFRLASAVPETFRLHPKLQKLLEDRKKMMEQGSVDWGLGESLAYATLLMEGTPIRLAGQDVQRGTFGHRNMVWTDQESGDLYSPLAHLASAQGRLDLVNSPLSEYGALGFEFGYSWAAPEALVLWEAQFGDFFNGAQIIIDQYLSSSEQKWFLPSSLTLLLPHAFEGQGSEHSSGRIERFLQMCAGGNMQIANATTPAQLFHLLRRQALRPLKKPLVLFTPKSLLRAPVCSSPLADFSQKGFEEILDDPTPPARPDKLLLCSGHVFYDLLQERAAKRPGAAILRIEQLYPLHEEKLKALLDRYAAAKAVVWVQEEPQNMGAWNTLRPRIEELLQGKRQLRYAGRKESASPAAGSHRIHKQELEALLNEAFS